MVSTEKKPNEKEIWRNLPRSEGTERAEQFIELSHIAYDRGDFKSALALCESAREIYESQIAVTSTKELLHVYEGITYSLSRLNRDAEAAKMAMQAFDFLRSEYPSDATNMLRRAGEFYYGAGEIEKALECHMQVMHEVDPDITNQMIGQDHYSVGYLSQKLGRYYQAIFHLEQARHYFKLEKDPENIYYCDEYLAVCYIALNNSVDSLIHAQKALDFAQTAQNQDLEIQANYRLGCANVLIGEFDEAISLLKKSLSMNVHSKHPDWKLAIDIEKEIAHVLIIKGKVAEAEQIRRRISTLQETICA